MVPSCDKTVSLSMKRSVGALYVFISIQHNWMYLLRGGRYNALRMGLSTLRMLANKDISY